jgi:UDP-glucose 4-epimerase
LLQNKPLSIYGDGQQSRAFTYIDDVAPHIARSVLVKAAYNEVFNIGSDVQHTVFELAQLVMDVMQVYSPINYLLARKEVVHAYADHSKLYKAFNIQTQDITPLETGLQYMANWVYQAGSRSSPIFKHIEITKNLPANWRLHHA